PPFTLDTRHPPGSPLPPYTALFRSLVGLLLVIRSFRGHKGSAIAEMNLRTPAYIVAALLFAAATLRIGGIAVAVPGAVLISSRRSEEHTTELQSREKLVCRPMPVKT